MQVRANSGLPWDIVQVGKIIRLIVNEVFFYE